VREFAQHFELVTNRRGHIKLATLKRSTSLDARPASSIGKAFEQTLASGHVYALGGVLGSDGPDLVGPAMQRQEYDLF